MSQIQKLKSQRSGILDLLRFSAVLVIFLAHYTDTFNITYNIVPENFKWSPFSRYASISLAVFFTVSGYVVTMTSMQRNLKDFLIARLSRIYPLFWISCIVAFILPRLIHEHTFLAHASFKTFLVNMTMVPLVFGYEMINPVYHTLMVELLFYFFLALIILFKLWNRILIIITILLIYCIVCSFDINASAYVFIPPFVAGMLFYFIKIKYAGSLKLHLLLAVTFFCSLAAGRVLVYQLGKFYKDPNALNIWTMSVIITVIYIVFYLATVNKIRIKSTVITRALGEIAYPFYLFHIYFLFLYWYFRNTLQADLLLLSILLLLIPVSLLLNILIEKPLSKLSSHILISATALFKKSN